MISCILTTFFIKIALLLNIFNKSNIFNIHLIEQYITLVEYILVLGIANIIRTRCNNLYNKRITVYTIILITIIIVTRNNIEETINIHNIFFIKDNIYFIEILVLFFSYSTIFTPSIYDIKPVLPLYVTMLFIPLIGISTYLSILYATDLEKYLYIILSPIILTIKYYVTSLLISTICLEYINIKKISTELNFFILSISTILILSICFSHLIYGNEDARTIQIYSLLPVLIGKFLAILMFIFIIGQMHKKCIPKFRYILSLILIGIFIVFSNAGIALCLSFYFLKTILTTKQSKVQNIKSEDIPIIHI